MMPEKHDVAYQGVPGAFSEDATIALLGDAVDRVAVTRFDDVFDGVVRGDVRHGVVPVENTLAGSVHAVYDLLGAKDVHIVGETTLRVSHVLAAPFSATVASLRRVYSHPVALSQCETFFREHPQIEPVAALNTAGAIAEVVARGNAEEAAIGSRRAADRYGGVVLREALEDDPENFTRFLLLARSPWSESREESKPSSGPRKTSLVFTLAHRPGSLAVALRAFADRALDLTKIESRPLRGRPFEYAFYADVVARDGAPLGEALRALGEAASSVRVFGTYPPG